eukprot:gnl/Dysnectes_brevis/7439_a12444_291.p1 GENE.gnl/Dysnectes_brevis/7439_a12444_291~~gnl/Dysnectes_brevis/7439_a12444_291.p1  ORF type:complete len:191 (+),score=51.55 gnl/Dysnectes_brevis/7439_a12444_291:187-759(+)
MEVLQSGSWFYNFLLTCMILIQLVHLAILCMVSWEMITQLLHKVARVGDILQMYGSLLLMYAGIYTTLSLVQPECFVGLDVEGMRAWGMLRPLQLYISFLYFSNVAMASIGLGDIYPNTIACRLIVMTETLCSVAFLCILMSNLNLDGEQDDSIGESGDTLGDYSPVADDLPVTGMSFSPDECGSTSLKK